MRWSWHHMHPQAGHCRTDTLYLWLNVISLLTGFLSAGWVGGQQPSVCVTVCRCVSHVSRTVGELRQAVVKKAGVFVSTPLCPSRNTESDKWLLSHAGDYTAGQRRKQREHRRGEIKMCLLTFHIQLTAAISGSYHWLIGESLHWNTDSICWSESNAAWSCCENSELS